MSYILDALKKSESETQQGEVPDISSEHNYGQYNVEAEPQSSWKQWILPIAIVGLFGACVVFALLWYSQQQSQPSTVAERSVAERTVENSQEEAEIKTSKEFVIEQQPTVGNTGVKSGNEGWSITEQEVTVRDPILKKIARQPRETQSTENTQSNQPSVRTNNTPKTSDGPSAQYSLADLPTLIYTTHIYATESKDRFVLLNGKPYEVGSRITSDLRVVDILENELQLEYKGQLFTVPSLEDINSK